MLLLDMRLSHLNKFLNNAGSAYESSSSSQNPRYENHRDRTTTDHSPTSLYHSFNYSTRCIESLDRTPFSLSTVEASHYYPIIKYFSFGNKVTFLDAQWSTAGDCFIAAQRDGCISIFTPNGRAFSSAIYC